MTHETLSNSFVLRRTRPSFQVYASAILLLPAAEERGVITSTPNFVTINPLVEKLKWAFCLKEIYSTQDRI